MSHRKEYHELLTEYRALERWVPESAVKDEERRRNLAQLARELERRSRGKARALDQVCIKGEARAWHRAAEDWDRVARAHEATS